MTPFALLINFTQAGIRDWGRNIEAHQSIINLLSFSVAAFTSFMMWLAYRRIKSEKWILYFSWSFGLLSLQFLLLLTFWYFAGHPEEHPTVPMSTGLLDTVILQLLSIANNLFGVSAARDLENKKPVLPRWCWWLAAGSLVTMIAGYVPRANSLAGILPYPYVDNMLSYEFLGRSFDAIFSACCLFLMGRAIFSNMSVRRHAWVATGAIIIACVYALAQLAYWFSPVFAARSPSVGIPGEAVQLYDSLIFALALPLKFGLCAFAYLLVIRFFETLNDVRKLQDAGINERQDYLSPDGVLKLIGEKLTDNPAADESLSVDTPLGGGFVSLIIKLPGESKKRIACIIWPKRKEIDRVKILDWIGEEFSPLSVKPGSEDLDKAFEWEKALSFVGDALTNEESKDIVWPSSNSNRLAGASNYGGNMNALVSAPIKSHGAAIGCLQVARCRYPFSQMAIRQIREISNLVSPAVQAYRELAGLDHMSIRFAEKQAQEETYGPKEAARVISEIIHDVFAPVVTRFHMDFGFFSQDPIYLSRRVDTGNLIEKINEEYKNKQWADFPESIVTKDIVTYTLLKKQLTARVTETLSYEQARSPDRFITGNMLLAVGENRDEYGSPALGITYLHRKAAATLASDAYLDFARDFYNDLLKGLGKELSKKLHSVEEWFELVRATLARAGFSWVVAGRMGKDEKFGNKEALPVLQDLSRSQTDANVTTVGEVDIKHYRQRRPELGTNHVLRLDLKASGGFILLGVERKGFGPELEFSSPWRTFLVNFAQIADAALARITFPEEIQHHLEAAQKQGIISAVVTTQTVMHQLSNSIQGQSSSISTLIDALKLKRLVAKDESVESILYAMQGSANRMQEMFQSFSRLTKMDDRRPCPLKDAATQASNLFELAMMRRDVKIDINVPPDVWIDVPYYVAALALANLVGNATDAVDREGEILIDAEKNGDAVLCSVRDNGRGVLPELIDKIFMPRISSKKNGSGLGLYLTHRSLIDNRSSIELTSTGPTGTVFTVTFPLGKKEAL